MEMKKAYAKENYPFTLEQLVSIYLRNNSEMKRRFAREKAWEKAIEKCGNVTELLLVLFPASLPVPMGFALGVLASIGKIPLIFFLNFVFNDGVITAWEGILVILTYVIISFLICLLPLALSVILTNALAVIHRLRVKHLAKSITHAIAQEYGILFSIRYIPGGSKRCPLTDLKAFVMN